MAGKRDSSTRRPKSSACQLRAYRRTAYGQRSAQRPVIHDIHRSISLCGMGSIPRTLGNATLICNGESASIAGTLHCHSAWGCPVCSPKLAAARAESLAPQIADLMLKGWSAWLLTLTVRHERGDGLSRLMDGLTEAWKGVTSGRAWSDWRGRGEGSAQFVRGFDVTHGRNGWHPHLHIMLLLPPGRDDAQWLLDRWVSCLAYQGFEALHAGLDCRRVDDAAAAAAYAVSPAAVYEPVAMAKKRARGEGLGRTPFEILSSAIADYEARRRGSRDIALWREYVSATKGRRQATTSQRLKLKPDLDERKGEDIDELAVMGRETVRELDRTRQTADLLSAAEMSGPLLRREAVADFLCRNIRARDWRILEPDPPDHSPPPEQADRQSERQFRTGASAARERRRPPEASCRRTSFALEGHPSP